MKQLNTARVWKYKQDKQAKQFRLEATELKTQTFKNVFLSGFLHRHDELRINLQHSLGWGRDGCLAQYAWLGLNQFECWWKIQHRTFSLFILLRSKELWSARRLTRRLYLTRWECELAVCPGDDTGEVEAASKLHHGRMITDSQNTKCTQLVDVWDLFGAMWRCNPPPLTVGEPPLYWMNSVCSQNLRRLHLVNLRSVSTKTRPIPRYVIFTHCNRLHNNHLLITDEFCFIPLN